MACANNHLNANLCVFSTGMASRSRSLTPIFSGNTIVSGTIWRSLLTTWKESCLVFDMEDAWRGEIESPFFWILHLPDRLDGEVENGSSLSFEIRILAFFLRGQYGNAQAGISLYDVILLCPWSHNGKVRTCCPLSLRLLKDSDVHRQDNTRVLQDRWDFEVFRGNLGTSLASPP